MSRRDDERLADILASAAAIADHLKRGGLDDGLVFDAVRVRLIEIGEAVKDIDPKRLATEAGIPWRDVAGMRDHLAHRYFDTAYSVVQATVEHDLPPLVAAVTRLLDQGDNTPGPETCPRTQPPCRPERETDLVPQRDPLEGHIAIGVQRPISPRTSTQSAGPREATPAPRQRQLPDACSGATTA